MLLNIYKVMHERNLKQCVQIEEALANYVTSFFKDDGLRNIKQELFSFLSNSEHHLEDKIRLLMIFLMNNNLSKAKILEIMNSSNIPEEKMEIFENTEKIFQTSVVDRVLNQNTASKQISHEILKENVTKTIGWKPFIKLLAENSLNNSNNVDLKNPALDMFESVIDEKKLRRVSSLNFHDVKNVIFFMTGFITHSEISVVRLLNKNTEGCKFYLGSSRIHTARSLIEVLDTRH